MPQGKGAKSHSGVRAGRAGRPVRGSSGGGAVVEARSGVAPGPHLATLPGRHRGAGAPGGVPPSDESTILRYVIHQGGSPTTPGRPRRRGALGKSRNPGRAPGPHPARPAKRPDHLRSRQVASGVSPTSRTAGRPALDDLDRPVGGAFPADPVSWIVDAALLTDRHSPSGAFSSRRRRSGTGSRGSSRKPDQRRWHRKPVRRGEHVPGNEPFTDCHFNRCEKSTGLWTVSRNPPRR